MPDHQRAAPVVEQLAQCGDLTDTFEPTDLDHRQRLVQAHGLAGPERVDLEIRGHPHPHLAARGEHVDGAVLERLEQHPVPAGRLTEPIDLLAEREQLLTRLLEGLEQLPITYRDRLEPRFEVADTIGRFGEPGPEGDHLGAQFFEFPCGSTRIRIL